MKKFNAKEFEWIAVIAVVTVVLALAVVIGAGAMVSSGDGFLLLALTLCGAVLNGINGFGRRTVKLIPKGDESRRGPQSGVALNS